MQIKGSCLCGDVQYVLKSEPKHVSHCHCNMCQKQHGAAFASYASVPKSDLVYTVGEHLLTSYPSSNNIVRKFCSICGSNIEWGGSPQYPHWVSIAIATFDTKFQPKKATHIHTESTFCWLDINDGESYV